MQNQDKHLNVVIQLSKAFEQNQLNRSEGHKSLLLQ